MNSNGQGNEEEEIKKQNEININYIQQYYHYNNISKVVTVKIPTLTQDQLNNNEEYASIKEDLISEIQKFGTINSFVLPRPQELE